MAMQISRRERVLIITTFVCLIFFLYWQFLLSPLLQTIRKTEKEIKALELQLEYSVLSSIESALAKKGEIEIFPKEEQLNYIIKFIDRKFRWFGIKMISLRQSDGEKKLTINLKFKASSYQFLGFLNSLSQLKTVLVIDSVVVNQEEDKVVVEMNLLSVYK